MMDLDQQPIIWQQVYRFHCVSINLVSVSEPNSSVFNVEFCLYSVSMVHRSWSDRLSLSVQSHHVPPHVLIVLSVSFIKQVYSSENMLEQCRLREREGRASETVDARGFSTTYVLFIRLRLPHNVPNLPSNIRLGITDVGCCDQWLISSYGRRG